MTMPEVVDFITGYAKPIAAPVQTGTTVTSVRRTDDGYRGRRPTRASGSARRVVLATGAFNVPQRARRSPTAVPPSVDDAHADGVPQPGPARRGRRARRRRVGDRRADRRTRSSARAGRSRWPSASTCGGRAIYRGRDIHWWMDAAGVLDERYDEVDDIVRARRVPSMQLAGSPERATFDLNALTEHRRAARRPARRHHATARRSSPDRCATSASSPTSSSAGCSTPSTSGRRRNGLDDSVPPPHRFAPTSRAGPAAARPRSRRAARSRRSSGRPASARTTPGSTSPVLDRKGMVRHDGGVVDVARACT